MPMLVIAGLAGCASREAASPLQATHIAYVVRRGFHTDIGLPAAGLDPPLQPLAEAFPGARSLLLGFGDRTFVQSRGHRWLGDWLLALLPGDGAMLVTGLRVSPDAAFAASAVVKLRLTATQWHALQGFLRASFAPSAGPPTRLAEGPYAGSRFYASSRTYDLLDTCNTWTAEALRAAGQPMPVALTLLAGQAIGEARRLPAAAVSDR